MLLYALRVPSSICLTVVQILLDVKDYRASLVPCFAVTVHGFNLVVKIPVAVPRIGNRDRER